MATASRWARAGVRRQLGALGFVYLIIVGIGAAVTLLALDRYNEDGERRRELLTDLAVLERLRAAYSDQETAQRGYIISGDATFLAPYETGRSTADAALSTLAQDLQGHEPLAENLSTIVTLADAWRVEYAEPEIEVRRTQGQEAASRLVATGAGRNQFDQLRTAVDALGASIAG